MTELAELERQLEQGSASIHRALAAVMTDVRKVTKTDVNSQQNYNFRGVDRVVNAVAKPLRDHGVLVLPDLLEERLEPFETSSKKTMWRSVVKVRYRFIGPTGDELAATVAGEGSDSLDKATSKAMSVAYRTALLQALCLPTSDPDPDSFSLPQEMPAGVPQSKLAAAKREVWRLAQEAGMDVDGLATDFSASTGKPIGEATAAELDQYATQLRGGKPQKPTRTVRRQKSPPEQNEPALPEPTEAEEAAIQQGQQALLNGGDTQ